MILVISTYYNDGRVEAFISKNPQVHDEHTVYEGIISDRYRDTYNTQDEANEAVQNALEQC